ncbi:MAG: type II secretion system major pseudopilin GspG [Sedimentisphaerales bacterium]|nr:type II secretion system major pseudopilin GspG [Sedimentisphaerales bacterium]
MDRKRQKRKAFTLVELLVVIIILSLLAGFVAPKMLKRVGKAKKDLARPKMTVIESAIERFGLDCGQYPDDSMGLDALLKPPAGLEEKWNGPYIKASQLLDPWGNPYIYAAEGQVNPGSFDIVSLGADGVEGGEGDNEDIFNE